MAHVLIGCVTCQRPIIPCQQFFFLDLMLLECWVGSREADGRQLGSGNLLRDVREAGNAESSKQSVPASLAAFLTDTHRRTHTHLENPHKYAASLPSKPGHCFLEIRPSCWCFESLSVLGSYPVLKISPVLFLIKH